MTRANCTFTVDNWDEKTFSEADGQLKLTHTEMSRTLHGDLEGQGMLQYLMYYGPEQQTRVIGVERISGVLGGKSGSFVLEHDGGDDGFEARGKMTVLPGSGTRELSGLRGSGKTVANRKGEMTFWLEYEIG